MNKTKTFNKGLASHANFPQQGMVCVKYSSIVELKTLIDNKNNIIKKELTRIKSLALGFSKRNCSSHALGPAGSNNDVDDGTHGESCHL